MIDPLHHKQHQPPKTQETQKAETPASQIANQVKKLTPHSFPPGVDLKGKTWNAIETPTTAQRLFQSTHGRGAQALRSASKTPPQSDDELDALATLFKKTTSSKTPKSKVSSKERSWSSPSSENINPKTGQVASKNKLF